eukprot:contig_8967_g2127
MRATVDGDAAVPYAPVEGEAAANDATAADSEDEFSSEDEDGDVSDDDSADEDLDDTVTRQVDDDADEDDDDAAGYDSELSSADEGTEDEAGSDADDIDGLHRVEDQEWETAEIAEEGTTRDTVDDDESGSDVDSDGSSDADNSGDDAAEDDLDAPSVRAAGGSDVLEPVGHADAGSWEDMSSDEDADSADDVDADVSDSEKATDLFGKPLEANVADADVTAWAAPAAGEGADQEAVRRIQLGDYVPLSAASPFVVGDADETTA